MSKVRVSNFAISLDGFGAGPNQDLENPLERAREAAQGKDVRVGGGVATVRQFWRARLLDELHIVQTPALLGTGESLFADLDVRGLGYACTERAATPTATHIVLTRA